MDSFTTWATKTQCWRRSFTPSTTTASPARTPFQRVVRTTWP
ncbi:MAG TPA: hypothetical protein VIH73_00080 [Acidimicrobiales bacterium]